jgi:hypothetical protein
MLKTEAETNTKLEESKNSSAIKFDSEKPRMDLLPTVALEEIAKVLTFGAVKYSSWNWAQGLKWSRLLGAACRHLFAYMRGEDKDKETGLSHLAHLGCCVVFLLWHEKFRKDLDDRFKDPDTKGEQV